jgi:transposase
MIPSNVKVFLASHPIDFRKGPDSLLSLVRDAGSDPFSGALYIFRAKRADRIKIVWRDGSGVCLSQLLQSVRRGRDRKIGSLRLPHHSDGH